AKAVSERGEKGKKYLDLSCAPARACSPLYAGLTILSHRSMVPTPSDVRPIRKSGRMPCSNVLVLLCLGAATRATPMTASLAPPCPRYPCLDREDQFQARSQHRPPGGTGEGLDFGGDEGRLKVAPSLGSDPPSPSVLQRDSRLFRDHPLAMTRSGGRRESPVRERNEVEREDQEMEGTTAVRGGDAGKEKIVITHENLPKMKNVVILREEGIIYCPIAKVASAEWKRSLRWMVGIEDWMGNHTNLHSAGKNGLERLQEWGLEGITWALESDRYLRFVVVRDPAERLVSAFLNKCVTDGYMRGRLNPQGAPNCAYLSLMPTLFPNATEATLDTHQRLRGLVEREPEDTFYHFASGILAEMKREGDACKVSNHHFQPQMCFCDLREILPAFHVISFHNMSAEAAAFAARIPEPLPISPHKEATDGGTVGTSKSSIGKDGPGGMAQGGRGTGVSGSRRQEIADFLTERFETARDEDVKVTGAADRKSMFLSNRVLRVVHQMFKEDYEVLGQYFPPGEEEINAASGRRTTRAPPR
ncbi:unnamed protein product, partial [Ectocarpus sp. 4 AP-2014]